MTVQLLIGDCRDRLREVPDQSVQCVVTSPPYFGLRDYGVEGQLGAEPTPQEFVAALREVFREVWRVLRDDGTLWLNLGDSYGARKQLLGVPWRVAFALQDDAWLLRQDIIYSKPNPMPESVRDRCARSHEYLFMLTKSQRYYYNHEAIRESAAESSSARLAQPTLHEQTGSARANAGAKTNGNMKAVGCEDGKRNRRSVWTVTTQNYSGAHFATFPPALVEPCIKAGTAAGDTVLDPFAGSGTTGYVADYLQRDAVLIEMNPDYESLIRERLEYTGMFNPLEVA